MAYEPKSPKRTRAHFVEVTGKEADELRKSYRKLKSKPKKPEKSTKRTRIPVPNVRPFIVKTPYPSLEKMLRTFKLPQREAEAVVALVTIFALHRARNQEEIRRILDNHIASLLEIWRYYKDKRK
jgi:hypothetical protein